MSKRHNDQKREFKLTRDVVDFLELDFKQFKKENKNYYDKKKELRYAYLMEKLSLLPDVLYTLATYSHIKAVDDVKAKLYLSISDVDFIAFLADEVDDGTRFENMELLPIVIRDIIRSAQKEVAEANAANPDGKTYEYDPRDLVNLSQLVLKKKLKKCVKAGIDKEVAFDILSVIPSDKVLDDKQIRFKMHAVMGILYEHSQTKEIDYMKIISQIIPTEYVATVFVFNLLERKEKFNKFTDNQKKFFINITEGIFDVMEASSNGDVKLVLKSYIDVRKMDDGKGTDAPRRYILNQIPTETYPNLKKIIDRMISDDASNERYLS